MRRCLAAIVLVALVSMQCHQGHPSTRAVCGDGVLEGDEECDDGAANADEVGGACRRSCRLPRCGDGVLDPGETCDDGLRNSATAPGACRPDCGPAACGDGVIDPGEACDEGDANADVTPNRCRMSCQLPRCGDGVVDTLYAERCDAGPDNSDTTPDACRTTCTLPRCGDGVVDPGAGEACDDGPANADEVPDACRTDCQAPRCGDGVLDPSAGEQCDDGEQNSWLPGAPCRPDCQPRRCGDGVLDADEICDDGPLNSDTQSDACRTDCTLPRCGDGVVDLLRGETCDEGSANQDGVADVCRTSCQGPRCGDAVVDTGAGELCDEGPANADLADAACRTDCSPQRCGDGVVDSGEECDLGAANSNLPNVNCRTDCRRKRCGDGVVDLGELCDLGAANSAAPGAACRPDCRPGGCGDGILDPGELCDLGPGNLDVPDSPCRTSCQPSRCGDGEIDSGEECDDGAANADGPEVTCRTNCRTNGWIVLQENVQQMLADPARDLVYLLTSGTPSTVIVFDTSLRQEVARLELPTHAWSFSISADGAYLVAPLMYETAFALIRPPDFSGFEVITTVARLASVAVTEDGTAYYLYGDDTHRLDIASGAASDVILTEHVQTLAADIQLHPDGRTLYMGEHDSSGSHLFRVELTPSGFGAFSHDVYDDDYGFWYPEEPTILCPTGNHVYFAGRQFDGANLNFIRGWPGGTVYGEAPDESVAVAATGLIDVELTKYLVGFPFWVSAAAFQRDSARLWYYRNDIGMLFWMHVPDLLLGQSVAERTPPAEPLANYRLSHLIHDPVRPRLYALDDEREVLLVIDAATLTPTHAFVMGSTPSSLDVDDQGETLYVGHIFTQAYARIDLATLQFLGFVPTPREPRHVLAMADDQVLLSGYFMYATPTLVDAASGAIHDIYWGWPLDEFQTAILGRPRGRHDFFLADNYYAHLARSEVVGTELVQHATSTGGAYAQGGVLFGVSAAGTYVGYSRAVYDGPTATPIAYVDDTIRTFTPDLRHATSSTLVYDVPSFEAVGVLPSYGYVQALALDGATLFFGSEGHLETVDLSQYPSFPLLASCGNGVVEAGEQCDDGNEEPLDGCHRCHASEFVITPGPTASSQKHRLALRDDGSGVITYSRYVGPLSQFGLEIMLRRFDATGGLVGAEVQVNERIQDDQSQPDARVAGDGRVFVAWADQYVGILSRAFAADLTPLGPETPICTGTDQKYSPQMDMLPTGQGVIAWGDGDLSPLDTGVTLQLFGTSFQPTSAEIQANTTLEEDQRAHAIGMDAQGGFVVAWRSLAPTLPGILAQRFSATGTKLGPEILVSEEVPNGLHTALAVAGDGRFVVTWVLFTDVFYAQTIRARSYAADGTPASGVITVNHVPMFDYGSELTHNVNVGMADDGRFAVAFNHPLAEYTATGVFWRWFSPTGVPLGPEERINRYVGTTWLDHLAMLPDGRAMIVWSVAPRMTSDYSIVAQRFGADGTPLGRLPW